MKLVLLLFFSFSFSAFAHQASLTNTGKELHWVNPSIPISIQTNTTDMTATRALNVIMNSINQWNMASSAQISVVSSSKNEVRFVSNFPYGSAVVGVTEISYNPAGAIQKAVVLLNDDHYFRSEPGMYGLGQYYLGDVVTHELGHLLGLSHSEVLNATMFYSLFSGQSTLAADDKSGVRARYDYGNGTITGYVKGGQSVGVLGAHVQAISRNTGEAISAISDENGYFEITGLDLNDTYYIYTSPVKNPESLPGYFSNVQSNFCPGTYVGSLFSPCGRENDGKPQGITLTESQPFVDVGTVTINCGLKTDQEYDAQKIQNNSSSVLMYDYGVERRKEKAFTGWFITNKDEWSQSDKFLIDLSQFTSLSGNQKYLKVSLVSYPFGTQLEYAMDISQDGMPVVSKKLEKSLVTQTYQTDFQVLLPLSFSPVQNKFEVSVKAKKLQYVSETFPSSGTFSSDRHLPFLIVASLYENGPFGMTPLIDNQVNLSDNEACLDAPFTFPMEKTRSPATEDKFVGSDQTMASTGCGTIEPPGNGPGSSLPLLATGFMLAALASSLLKSRKKFLS